MNNQSALEATRASPRVVVQGSLLVDATTFNTAIGGADEILVNVQPSSSVGSCGGSFVTVTLEYLGGAGDDCNLNGVPDSCDIAGGISMDCNGNGTPDECENDCNDNGFPDECDITGGASQDCNGNGIPDECDVLDPRLDCNGNGIVDACGIAGGTENDCNSNGIPDECDVGLGEVDADMLLADLTAGADDIAALVPNRFNFSDGVSGSSINDGGGDMYDGGNILNTDLASSIPYTGSVVMDADASFGVGSRYFTSKTDGLFVMAAVDVDIDTFMISGNLGADGSGTVDGFDAEVTFNFVSFAVLVKRVHSAGDSSVNHIIIVPGPLAGLTHTIPSTTDGDDDTVSGLLDRNEVFYLLVSRTLGRRLEDADALAIVDAFLALLPFGAGDCNGNMILDECEIGEGSLEDCDGNGLPDVCEDDCDANGIADVCEIADGSAEDCNANGRPDFCDLTSGEFSAESDELGPFGAGAPQTYFLADPPLAADTVRLTFRSRAELCAGFVSVDLNGNALGDIFGNSGTCCPGEPDTTTMILDAATFNDSILGGGIEIMMIPSPNINEFCDDPTFIQVSVRYESTGFDLDGDGIVDECEVCPEDINGNLTVDFGDLLLVIAQWGICPPVCLADLDRDGNVGFSDVLQLFGAWGPCPGS
ncbi:MAG: hypothetical protein GY715_00645 [Planctomycetes bacterium]|nr:hypothetical protein [Planctomycetota bacterium]